MSRHARFTPRVLEDIFLILKRSQKKFGSLTASRYQLLIDQAMIDLARDAHRPGTTARFDFQDGLYFYHIKHSKAQVVSRADRILHPRHLIVYRLPTASELHVIRILHERMRFLDQQFPIEYT